MSSFFVTGTDTGCGKTYVSCALLQLLAAGGRRTAGMKPVATGSRKRGGVLVSDDVERLVRAANTALPDEFVNPYSFEPPSSPHIAAEMAGAAIRLEVIENAFRECVERADIVVVEGVGGWRVPLGPDLWLPDMVAALDLEVVLVVGVKLGCINHAVLTFHDLAASGAVLRGWVANVLEPGLIELDQVVATVAEQAQAPCLGRLDFAADDAVNAVALSAAADCFA